MPAARTGRLRSMSGARAARGAPETGRASSVPAGPAISQPAGADDVPVHAGRGLDLDHLAARCRASAASGAPRVLSSAATMRAPRPRRADQIHRAARRPRPAGPGALARSSVAVEPQVQRQRRAVLAVRRGARTPSSVAPVNRSTSLDERSSSTARRSSRRASPSRPRPARCHGQLERASSAASSSTTSSRYVAGDQRARQLAVAPAGPAPAARARRRPRSARRPAAASGRRAGARCARGSSGTRRDRRRHVGAGARVGEPVTPVGVQREVQPVGMAVAAAEAAALEAGVAVARRAGWRAPAARAAPSRASTARASSGQRGRHLEQRPPGEIARGSAARRRGLAGLVQVGVERLRRRRRRGVQLAEPAPEIGRARRPGGPGRPPRARGTSAAPATRRSASPSAPGRCGRAAR